MNTAPHSLEAERAILGGCLIRPSAYEAHAAALQAQDFYLPAHRDVFEAIGALRARQAPLDVISLADELRNRGSKTDEGFLLSMAGEVPTAENIAHYVKIVEERSTLRRLLVLSADISLRASVPGAVAEDLLSEARVALAELELRGDGGPVRVGDALADALRVIEDKASGKATHGMVHTGIKSYDNLLGGLMPDRMTVVAARPGIGKSALVGGILLRAAKRGIPCLLFSLEMSKQELIERFISAESRVPAEMLHTGRVDYESWKGIFPSIRDLEKAPLWVDDRVLTCGQIMAAARAWKAKRDNERRESGEKSALVAIDYLGLIKSGEKTQNRNLEVGGYTRAGKHLSKDGFPVIMVAQLNRDMEKEKRRPRLSDLRDSGEIEQDADTVIFPWREPPLEDSGKASLIVPKNRGGRTGEIDCYWHGPTMTFTGLEDAREDESTAW